MKKIKLKTWYDEQVKGGDFMSNETNDNKQSEIISHREELTREDKSKEEKALELNNRIDELKNDYNSNVAKVENVKWYNRKHVLGISGLFLLLFIALYIEARTIEMIPTQISVGLQFGVICVSVLMVFVVESGKVFKKYAEKLKATHIKRLDEVKSQQNNDLSAALQLVNTEKERESKLYAFRLALTAFGGMIIGFVLYEGTEFIQSNTPAFIMTTIVLVFTISYTVNEVLKLRATNKVYVAYRKQMDLVIEESEKYFESLFKSKEAQ